MADGDTVVLDLDRTDPDGEADHARGRRRRARRAGQPARIRRSNLIGLNAGETKTFIVHFPEDYAVKEMANTDVTYNVTVKDIRRKVLPELDDEFAKDLGDFESLAALRDRVRADMQAEAETCTRAARARATC